MKQLFLITLLGGLTTALVAQPTRNIGGTLSANLSLSKDTCYILTSSLVVPSTYTLAIEAGTKILCDAQTSVVIERGAQIQAAGTASLPIVFTSSKVVGTRAAGDWGGLLLSGYAANNIVDGGGGVYNIFRAGANRAGGGTPIANSDNSGTLTYVRIEFAGGGAVGETEAHGLMLNSTGSQTTIDHIQISASGQDGLKMIGGRTDLKEVYVLDAGGKGLNLAYGNLSKMQTVLIQQKDAAANLVSGTYGFVASNNQSNPSFQPYTDFTASNVSILGIKYCDPNATVSSNFLDGFYFDHNAKGNVYNAAVLGMNRNGLHINDQASAVNTANDALNVAYSSFTGNASGDYGQGAFTWSGNGCDVSMAAWLSGGGGCRENGNQFSPFSAAYDNSFCADFCAENFAQNFVLDAGTTALDFSDYTAAVLSGFDEFVYRGAIQETDEFANWISTCPREESYCSLPLMKSHRSDSKLGFYPNPAHSYMEAYFTASTTGKGHLFISDRITGKVYHEQAFLVTQTGEQKIPVAINGLRENVYMVKVVLKDQTLHGQLVVK